MARIGALEIKHSEVECPLSFTQEVIEDGERVDADFVYERHLFADVRPLAPGNLYYSTGLRYRRAE